MKTIILDGQSYYLVPVTSDINTTIICAWNHIIENGQLYMCFKTFDKSGQQLYIKGNIYKSERDGCITDELGNKDHFWPAAEDQARRYFCPLTFKEFEEYQNGNQH